MHILAMPESINYKVTWLCVSEPMANSELQIRAWWSCLTEV